MLTAQQLLNYVLLYLVSVEETSSVRQPVQDHKPLSDRAEIYK